MGDIYQYGPRIMATWVCIGCEHHFQSRTSLGARHHCSMSNADLGHVPVTPKHCPYRPDTTAPQSLVDIARQFSSRDLEEELRKLEGSPL